MTVGGWVGPPSWVHRASSWFRWGILVLGSRTLGLADPLLLVEVAWVSEGIPPLSMEPHNCQHHSIAGHTSRKVGSPRRPFWKRQSDPAMLFEGSGDASPMKSATPYVTFGELGNAPPPRYSWPENIAGIHDRKHRRSMISWQAVACGAKWRKRLDYTMLVLDLVPEVWDDGRLAWSNGCLPVRWLIPQYLESPCKSIAIKLCSEMTHFHFCFYASLMRKKINILRIYKSGVRALQQTNTATLISFGSNRSVYYILTTTKTFQLWRRV